jgi:hypothetical protein
MTSKHAEVELRTRPQGDVFSDENDMKRMGKDQRFQVRLAMLCDSQRSQLIHPSETSSTSP